MLEPENAHLAAWVESKIDVTVISMKSLSMGIATMCSWTHVRYLQRYDQFDLDDAERDGRKKGGGGISSGC